MSRFDNLRFAVAHMLPIYLQGLFTRNALWVTVFSSLHPDPLSVRFISRMRRKYKSQFLAFGRGKRRRILVLDGASTKNILDNSPETFAEPRAKREGMERFQPGAVTISREVAWKSRRRFNEYCLETSNPIHPLSSQFLKAIHHECDGLVPLNESGQISWTQFKAMFDRLALQFLFGPAAADDKYLIGAMVKLMKNANRSRFLPPRKRLLNDYYSAVRGYLRWPGKNCLARVAQRFSSGKLLRTESQFTHWLFAMSETLATNAIRALAMIAIHKKANDEVRLEIAGQNLDDPNSIEQMTVLSGCLQEAMRLWPTTPLLVRETTVSVEFAGEELPPRSQVMIFNSFNHRDPEFGDDLDRFVPERWTAQRSDVQFNHLSNGSQSCAGKNLAIWIGTAVMASLMRRHQYTLLNPTMNPNRPLSHAMNHFRTRLSYRPSDEG